MANNMKNWQLNFIDENGNKLLMLQMYGSWKQIQEQIQERIINYGWTKLIEQRNRPNSVSVVIRQSAHENSKQRNRSNSVSVRQSGTYKNSQSGTYKNSQSGTYKNSNQRPRFN